MDTDTKIGQILSIAVGHHSGAQINPWLGGDLEGHRQAMADDLARIAGEVAEFNIGGICYFAGRPDGNLPAEVAAATTALQSAAGSLPLLISTDQEGGRVARLRRGFSLFPSAMGLAALDDLEAITEACRISATEMRAVGINHVFAPVADLNSNPRNPVIGTRSFGSDPASAAACVRAAVEGYRLGGVASTVKHFPGHGDTATDSHLSLPVLTRDLDALRRWDLPTFAAAIDGGVDAVMGGHLMVPALDHEPATFSYRILTELLRDELGFTGVVCTDALEMKGAVDGRDANELVVDALLAGVDQLLMPVDTRGAIEALRRAVDQGRVPMERLDAAVARVLALKEKLGLLETGPGPSDPARVGQHQADAVALAARSVTVLGAPLPQLDAGSTVALLGERTPFTDALATALTDRAVVINSDPAAATTILIICHDAWRTPEDTGLAEALADHPDAVLVACGTPYDAALVDSARSIALTYGNNATQAAGLAAVLTDAGSGGRGRLPVDILNADGTTCFARGAGIVA